MPLDLVDKRCLVTGGTGFIGGRLAERLAVGGARVRVLARNLSRAARVGRHPVELVRGDIARPEDAERAVEGCDHVFHCVFGKDGSLDDMRTVTVDGTRHVVEACRRHGARLVHVSTVSVYGTVAEGEITEESPAAPGGDFYAETKLEAERAVLEAARSGSVPAAVVQPTVVYGPFAPAWTVRTFQELTTGRVTLVDGGRGICNVVYVDDVVQALLLAATVEGAVGETFLVSGPEPVTWREFYRAHEEILGYESHVDRSPEEALAAFQRRFGKKALIPEGLSLVRENPDLRERLKATREAQTLLKAAKHVVPVGARQRIRGWLRGARKNGVAPPADEERPVHLLGPAGIQIMSAKSVVRIDKARRVLGYEPAFDLAASMARIGAWARWAGALEPPAGEA